MLTGRMRMSQLYRAESEVGRGQGRPRGATGRSLAEELKSQRGRVLMRAGRSRQCRCAAGFPRESEPSAASVHFADEETGPHAS